MEEILKVTNISKSYKSKKAVDNFNLSVRKGSVFGLLGANGAGKSTTIECILGIKSLNSGSVSILGLRPDKDRKKLFQRVGVQFQDSNYQNEIKVYELCEETACLYDDAEDWHNLLKQFGIEDKEKNAVKDLSGGERQRLFITLALIPKPDIVFLDELTTGLDVKARRTVWNILKRLKEDGLTIILTSHFMDEVENLCDEICILRKGKTVFYGKVSEAVSSSPYENFEDAYLWYAEEGELQ